MTEPRVAVPLSPPLQPDLVYEDFAHDPSVSPECGVRKCSSTLATSSDMPIDKCGKRRCADLYLDSSLPPSPRPEPKLVYGNDAVDKMLKERSNVTERDETCLQNSTAVDKSEAIAGIDSASKGDGQPHSKPVAPEANEIFTEDQQKAKDKAQAGTKVHPERLKQCHQRLSGELSLLIARFSTLRDQYLNERERHVSEEELQMRGATHPELLKELTNIDSRYQRQVVVAERRLKYTQEIIELVHQFDFDNADKQLAYDKRCLLDEMRKDVQSKRIRLDADLETSLQPPLPIHVYGFPSTVMPLQTESIYTAPSAVSPTWPCFPGQTMPPSLDRVQFRRSDLTSSSMEVQVGSLIAPSI